MQTSFQLASQRLQEQYWCLNHLSHNQANADTPGFRATDTGYRQGSFASWLRQREGSLKTTGGPTDLSLHPGTYLQVQSREATAYTRRGDLRLNANQQLVVGLDDLVLDNAGKPITIHEGPVGLTSDGTVLAAGKPVAKLGLYRMDEVEGDGNRFQPKAGTQTVPDDRGIRPGELESGNVDTAEEQANLVALLERARVFGELTRIHDQTQEKAIRELARGR